MDNKGFTLVEIITTVALISVLMLLVIPNLLSQLSDKSREASEKEQAILVEAARAYVDKHHEYFEKKTTECITITMLENDGLYSMAGRNQALPQNAAVKYTKVNGVEKYDYKSNGCS